MDELFLTMCNTTSIYQVYCTARVLLPVQNSKTGLIALYKLYKLYKLLLPVCIKRVVCRRFYIKTVQKQCQLLGEQTKKM